MKIIGSTASNFLNFYLICFRKYSCLVTRLKHLTIIFLGSLNITSFAAGFSQPSKIVSGIGDCYEASDSVSDQYSKPYSIYSPSKYYSKKHCKECCTDEFPYDGKHKRVYSLAEALEDIG